MIAPSLIIYSLYLIQKNEKITFIFVIVLFIILTLIKITTLLWHRFKFSDFNNF